MSQFTHNFYFNSNLETRYTNTNENVVYPDLIPRLDLGILHKTNQNERISHIKEQGLLSENGFEFEQQRYKVVTNPLPTYNQIIR